MTKEWMNIVGIVGDIRQYGFALKPIAALAEIVNGGEVGRLGHRGVVIRLGNLHQLVRVTIGELVEE